VPYGTDTPTIRHRTSENTRCLRYAHKPRLQRNDDVVLVLRIAGDWSLHEEDSNVRRVDVV
jgi:hypothetical protein